LAIYDHLKYHRRVCFQYTEYKAFYDILDDRVEECLSLGKHMHIAYVTIKITFWQVGNIYLFLLCVKDFSTCAHYVTSFAEKRVLPPLLILLKIIGGFYVLRL
jgi:hypothetical protein